MQETNYKPKSNKQGHRAADYLPDLELLFSFRNRSWRFWLAWSAVFFSMVVGLPFLAFDEANQPHLSQERMAKLQRSHRQNALQASKTYGGAIRIGGSQRWVVSMLQLQRYDLYFSKSRPNLEIRQNYFG
jgi:hypothetical protein